MRGAVHPSIHPNSGASRIHAEKYKITTLWRRTTAEGERESADEDAHLGRSTTCYRRRLLSSTTMISITYWTPMQQNVVNRGWVGGSPWLASLLPHPVACLTTYTTSVARKCRTVDQN